MPLKINTAAIHSISMHSNALSILYSIAHPCEKEGAFVGMVFKGKQVVAQFKLNVNSENSNSQVNIDISSLVAGKKGHKRHDFFLTPSGFAMFYVSAGESLYVVELREAESESKRPFYSTKTLQKGDVYSAMLIRPGLYNVTNTKTKDKATYTVLVPEGGQKAILSAQPLLVNCTKRGFTANSESVPVSEGILFVIETASVITIDLFKNEKGELLKDLRPDKIMAPWWVRPINPRPI